MTQAPLLPSFFFKPDVTYARRGLAGITLAPHFL